jgi:hypothetical protein
MTDTVIKLTEKSLSQAGFTPIEDYCASSSAADYPAYWRISGISLGGLCTSSSSTECSADVDVTVRMMGAKKDFSDKETLEKMAQNAAKDMIFSSTQAVKKLCFGDVSRNVTMGRLEYTMSIRYCISIRKGA